MRFLPTSSAAVTPFVAVLALALPWPTYATAQDADETTVDRADWSEFYLKMADQLQVTAGDLGNASLTRKPFFSWDNPVRSGRTQGDFFIWFARGQPVLVGTLFSYDWPTSDRSRRSVAVELHGLSNQAIEVSYASKIRWKAPANSVQALRLKNTPSPRKQRTQRLVEMRRIANRLKATTVLEGQPSPLRLLPTPLYRFDPPETGEDEQVLDGAIFAMVTGTDPELLLVMQAQRLGRDQFAWFLTTARFTDLPLTIELDDEVISQTGSASEDPLYFHMHGVHFVPTKLGPEADAMIGQ